MIRPHCETKNRYVYLADCDVVSGIVILQKATSKLFVVRKEPLPFLNEKIYTTISGCIEYKDSSIEEAFLREIEEETGIIIRNYTVRHKKEFKIAHKAVQGSLFSLIIETVDYLQTEPKGDGTLHEKIATTLILPREGIFKLIQSNNIDMHLYFLLTYILGTGIAY